MDQCDMPSSSFTPLTSPIYLLHQPLQPPPALQPMSQVQTSVGYLYPRAADNGAVSLSGAISPQSYPAMPNNYFNQSSLRNMHSLPPQFQNNENQYASTSSNVGSVPWGQVNQSYSSNIMPSKMSAPQPSDPINGLPATHEMNRLLSGGAPSSGAPNYTTLPPPTSYDRLSSSSWSFPPAIPPLNSFSQISAQGSGSQSPDSTLASSILLSCRRPLHPPGTAQPKGRGHSSSSKTPGSDEDSSKSLPCECCGARFARKHDLDRHRRVHTLEAPYVCKGCGRGYRRSDARKRHWDQDRVCWNTHVLRGDRDDKD